jgi:hypothetical protein
MEKRYVRPEKVTAPKRRWALVSVLCDDGEGETALALGTWEGEPRLAMRWNGSAKRPIGNPQSRGMATWFLLPPKLNKAIVEDLPRENKALARSFLKRTLATMVKNKRSGKR